MQVQGINGKRSKFESFQNLKDNKFSAYKYERNIFIGKSNQDNNEDYEYIKPEQKKIKIAQKIHLEVQNEIKEQEVDNLWQLWDKLGQQQQSKVSQQKFSEQKDIENNVENQLTEDQLLQCFGQQNQNKQNHDKIDKKSFQEEKLADNDKTKNQQNEGQILNEDKDLMDIWGQPQNQNIHAQNINQSNILNENQQIKKQLQNQQYEWQDQKQKQTKNNKFQSNQNIKTLHQQQDDDFKMELQDPNKINLKYRNTSEQEQIKSKPSTAQATKDISTSQISKPSISNNNQKKNTTSKEVHQKNHSTQPSHKNKDNNHTLSIINEILLQNNTKTMTKLIPGKHYQIFDTKKFVLHPFKQNTYSYFGIQATNHSLLQPSQKIDTKDHTFYLYSFQTKQAFLELKPQPFDKSYIDFLSVKKTVIISPEKKQTKKVLEYKTDLCYKIRVCSTKQHIATLFYKTIKDGYLYDLRLFDQYEHVHSQPVALIQVKDGYVNDCCYCDTNVFLQKGYLKDPQRALFGQRVKFQIQKLKMILNLKNGKLTANMGIGGIESSPFNCCLENQQSQKFIYLMGLLLENANQHIHFVNTQQNDYTKNKQKEKQDVQKDGNNTKKNTFIIKVGQGVTPLLGLVIAAGRKIYIDSFQ